MSDVFEPVHKLARVQPRDPQHFYRARCGYESARFDSLRGALFHEFTIVDNRVTCPACLSGPAACAEAS